MWAPRPSLVLGLPVAPTDRGQGGMGRKWGGQETRRPLPCESLACTGSALSFCLAVMCVSMNLFVHLPFSLFFFSLPLHSAHTCSPNPMSKQLSVLQPLGPEAGKRKASGGASREPGLGGPWGTRQASRGSWLKHPPSSTWPGLSPLEPLGKHLRRPQSC